MSRRSRSFNAFEQATTAAIDDAVTSIPLDSVANLTPPGYLVIDPDDPLLREYIFYTEINALVLDNVSRGLEGSAGGVPQEHSSGARVRAVSVHQWLDDIFDDIEDLEALQSDYLLLDGSRPMVGNLDMGSTNRIVDLANGLSDQDAATLKQVTDGDLLLLDLAGTRPMTGALSLAVGTEALPGLVFDGDATTGMYEQAATVIGWAVAGTEKMSLAPNGLRVGAQGAEGAFMWASNPSVANPAYAFDTDQNTGMYLLTDNVIGWAVNGAEAMSLGNGLRVGPSTTEAAFMTTGTPSVSNPAYSFNGDTSSGMYRVAADIVGISAGGVLSGQFFPTQVRLPPVYGDTQTGTADMIVLASGQLRRITSTMAMKTDFQPLSNPLDTIMALNPFSFLSTNPNDDPDQRHIGLGAEEVAAAIPEADKGDNYDDRSVLAYLVAAVQELARK